jgi:hypothetical protein
MWLTDHATSNFSNNMYTAAVFLDIEKAFDTTWHLGLLYKLSELKFSIGLIKLISSFFFFSEKIRSLGGKWNIYAEGYSISSCATKFRPVLSIVLCVCVCVCVCVNDTP